MAIPTLTDWTNAKENLDIYENVINGADNATVTLRDGITTVKTLQNLLKTLQAYNVRGAWASTTAYAVKDVVSSGGIWYFAATAHTSGGSFATDLSGGKWAILQFDFSNIAASMTIGSSYNLTVGNIRLNTNTISSISGAINLVPLSGQNLNITLGTTGDFAVNTNQLYVDTSAGAVGIGTTTPNISSATGRTLTIESNQINAIEMSTINDSLTSGGEILSHRFYLGTARNLVAKIGINTIGSGENAADLTFGTSTAGTLSERLRITSAGQMLVGTTVARSNFFGSSTTQMQLETNSIAGISVVRNTNDATGSWAILAKSRGGSVGSNTVVQSGDTIGLMSFQGADGTNLIETARISAAIDGTPGTNDMPGRLVFSTTADGASSPTERMRITSAGNVGIGTTSPNANAILDVSSTTKAFMPPRMTTTQKNNIPSPTAGMVVYDSTLNKLCVYTTTWETVTSV